MYSPPQQINLCLYIRLLFAGHHHIHVTIEGGTLFSLLAMFTVSTVAGALVQMIQLPPLLGMLLTGVMLRSPVTQCSLCEV